MSYKSEEPINYKQSLLMRRYLIRKQIKELERIVYKAGAVMDDDWFKKHKQLCFFNIDYETVKSRLKNLNNFKGGIAVIELDNNNHK